MTQGRNAVRHSTGFDIAGYQLDQAINILGGNLLVYWFVLGQLVFPPLQVFDWSHRLHSLFKVIYVLIQRFDIELYAIGFIDARTSDPQGFL